MNIFALDHDPRLAAQAHCDPHVVKMVLEYAQLLSTTWHVVASSVPVGLYKPTHISHPSCRWVRESRANYVWLYSLFEATSDEYTYRYGKVHSTWQSLHSRLREAPRELPDIPATPIAQAMPDRYRRPSLGFVEAYRDYYRNEKYDLLRYTRRPPPKWLWRYE